MLYAYQKKNDLINSLQELQKMICGFKNTLNI
jgi:hypothetical protein